MVIAAGKPALRASLRSFVGRSGLGLELVPRQMTRACITTPPRPSPVWGPRVGSTLSAGNRNGYGRGSSGGHTDSLGVFTTSAGLSLGLFGFFQSRKPLHSESFADTPPPAAASSPLATPSTSKDLPQSQVNPYNLGFGTVCGICAGVFIKKGAKFIAFLFGGAFILLQYLNSQGLVRVNWSALSKRYESTLDRAAAPDARGVAADNAANGMTESVTSQRGWKDSRAARLWNRFVHFLTADFPTRGTFLAGLALGLRLG